jgi:uncharacterized protein YecE (DUF72 family)
MRVYTGTSGFSFDEWQGHFYPGEVRADERLAYYATRLSSVEINNTFYQTPKPAILEGWRDTVPREFRFAIKAPRRITHVQRLKEAGPSMEHFLRVVAVLGEQLGPVLFQLPPFLRKDSTLLGEFLTLLPRTINAAFEFRHASWFDEQIFALLAEHHVALCGGDMDDEKHSPPQVATAHFGYLRLRAPTYDASSLRAWFNRIIAEPWTEAYVYLKHEVLGPTYASLLAAMTTEDRPKKTDDAAFKATEVGAVRRRKRERTPSQ